MVLTAGQACAAVKWKGRETKLLFLFIIYRRHLCVFWGCKTHKGSTSGQGMAGEPYPL